MMATTTQLASIAAQVIDSNNLENDVLAGRDVTVSPGQLIDMLKEAAQAGVELPRTSRSHVKVTGYGPRNDVVRKGDLPHDYESLRDADEGGLGPCAVCGHLRGAPIHS